MRRIPAIAAVLGLTAFALVGCSSVSPTDPAACEREASDAPELDLVTVGDDIEDVRLTSALHAERTVFADLSRGDGMAVATPGQDVVFSLSVINGTTGEVTITTDTRPASIANWAPTLPGLDAVLTCATEGSRIVAAVAPDDLSPDALAALGVDEGDTAVMVIDLQKVYLGRADGAAQYHDGRGMPTVVLAPDGRPGITIPDGAAPEELIVQVLKKGDGEKVTTDAAVRVHYTGVTWNEEQVFDSSWESGRSAAFSLDQVIPGFSAALEGQTVGSQILAVIPPDEGYGDAAQGDIPAGSTLVFVIDILGIDEVAAE